MNQQDDTIDISILIKKLNYPFKLIFNHKKIFITYIFASIIIAITLNLSLPAKFAGSSIIKSNEVNDRFYLNMLLDIQTLAKDNDIENLSKQLKISRETASHLKGISIIAINKGQDSSSSAVITYEMTEKNEFNKIEKAVIGYMENNDHYVKLRFNRLNTINKLEEKIKNEITEMDSVKNIIINNITPKVSSTNGIVYNVPIDPYKAYDESMKRFKDQLWLISQKEHKNSFELIKECVYSSKPIWPKISTLLLFILPISLLLALIHANIRQSKISG